MFSCKINKANFDFQDQKEVASSQNPDKKSFAVQNFRLLTSHLKSRNQVLDNPPLNSQKLSRPKTTPNLYWNFMNFEERKKAKSPPLPDLEKTLQRLNIRSFNNILRSQSMRKKTGGVPFYRNSLLPMKTESGKLRKWKKAEFYTLDNVKYNNYKYQKINLGEENTRASSIIPEKEKKIHEEKDFILKNQGNKDLIEKLKANRIYYFEKNKFLLKKQFDQFYKMSENIKILKQELKHSNINDKPDLKISRVKGNDEAFFPLEKFKWETFFFNELKSLLHISSIVQKKMNKNEDYEDFEGSEIKIEHYMKSKGEAQGEDLEGLSGYKTNFFFFYK